MAARAQIGLRRPSVARIRQFVREQRELPFSYQPIGATADLGPGDNGATIGDYTIDSVQAQLGNGSDTYRRARAALQRWSMFDIGWVSLCWPDTRICTGSAVAVLARVATGWLLNAARVAYVVEESGDIERSGFAYGTLPGHFLRGEERFVIEWDRQSDRVWYQLVAMSRPQHALAWASYPVVRALQRRFRHDSIRAMQRAAAP